MKMLSSCERDMFLSFTAGGQIPSFLSSMYVELSIIEEKEYL
jgi:hypothetical protein